jgi:hypothetical protein
MSFHCSQSYNCSISTTKLAQERGPFTVGILNNKLQINYKLLIRFWGGCIGHCNPFLQKTVMTATDSTVSRITKLHLSVLLEIHFTFRLEASPSQSVSDHLLAARLSTSHLQSTVEKADNSCSSNARI